jgi:thiamine-phosphate pyrophosphorylase
MLQFITDGTTPEQVIKQVEEAIKGGCRWVQVRMKDTSDSDITKVILVVTNLCKNYNTTLLLDDRVELAKKLGVDGVHLGKEDMHPDEARKILGPDAIIGATANSLDDIIALSKTSINYLGVGPFRFTTTKKKLAPVLGLEGYKAITDGMKAAGINLPLVAIGGITLEDVPALMATGITGIAISGAIAHADNPAEATSKFIQKLKTSYNS